MSRIKIGVFGCIVVVFLLLSVPMLLLYMYMYVWCNKGRQTGGCTLTGYNKATKTCDLSVDDPQDVLDTSDEMSGVFVLFDLYTTRMYHMIYCNSTKKVVTIFRFKIRFNLTKQPTKNAWSFLFPNCIFVSF